MFNDTGFLTDRTYHALKKSAEPLTVKDLVAKLKAEGLHDVDAPMVRLYLRQLVREGYVDADHSDAKRVTYKVVN